MALPVTITGISTAVAPVGPFKGLGSVAPFIITTSSINPGNIIGSSANSTKWGQSFTTTGGVTAINSVAFWFSRVLSPADNLICEIFATDGAGSPTGSPIATSNPLLASSVSTTASQYTLTFATPVAVTPSTKYVAAISRTGAIDNVNYCRIQGQEGVNASEFSFSYNGSTSAWGAPGVNDWRLQVNWSGDAYYFFGRDGTTATTLQAYKAGVAGTIYSLSTARSSSSSVGHVSVRRQCQTFTSGSIVASVAVYLATTGSPTDAVQVDIYATSASIPTGASLGTSVSIPASSLTASAAQYTFTFSAPITLPSSAKYAAVVSRTGSLDSTNCYRIFGVTSSADPAENAATDTNGTWGALAGDYDLVVMGAAGDTTTGWSSIATKTGFTTAILALSGYRAGNVIHLLVADGTAVSAVGVKYVSFDMLTETFLTTTETVNAAAITGPSTQAYGVAIMVRQNGEVVCFYNGVQSKTSGTFYSRLYYKRRTALNIYTQDV